MSARLPFLGGLCGLDRRLRMCPCQQLWPSCVKLLVCQEYNQNFKIMLKTVNCDKTDTLIFNIIKNSQ